MIFNTVFMQMSQGCLSYFMNTVCLTMQKYADVTSPQRVIVVFFSELLLRYLAKFLPLVYKGRLITILKVARYMQ